MVYTNCKDKDSLTFDHKEINNIFQLDPKIEVPFMCIENPFVAIKKAMNKKGNKEAYLN